MEVEKLLKVCVEYFSDYLRVLLATISSPRLEFPPVESQVEESKIQGSDPTPVKVSLNPKLLSFLLISSFIGSTFNKNIPGRNEAPEFVMAAVIVIACWLLISSLIHLICKVFGGRASFVQTLSVNSQVLATVYVLSSFATFLWGVVVAGLGSGRIAGYLQNSTWHVFIRQPIYVYFVTQFLFVLIYLPWANVRVHRLNSSASRMRSKGAFSAVLSLAETALLIVVFLLLSFMIAGLSETSYRARNIPFSESEVGLVLLIESRTDNVPLAELRDGTSYVTLPRSGRAANLKKRYATGQYAVRDAIPSAEESASIIDQLTVVTSPATLKLPLPSTAPPQPASPERWSRAKDDPPFIDRGIIEEKQKTSAAVPLGRCLL